tara:strand:- start:306 stop:929 length:624 start_codon:yes stop_codon:yes gene_type:complete
MTAKIKLKHSGGNSVIIAAPDSNPTSDRTLKLPSDGDGTILTSNSSVGKILKIETTIKTDAFSHNNNTPTDITGMAVSIQPSASNSKIFITTTLCCGGGDNLYAQFNLLRGSTHIGASTYATGNQRNATFGYATPSLADGDYKIYSVAYQILDTPLYTLGDTITYKLQCASNTLATTNLFINRPQRTNNGPYIIGGSSTITAMEVAA